jgi:hypothetical protein
VGRGERKKRRRKREEKPVCTHIFLFFPSLSCLPLWTIQCSKCSPTVRRRCGVSAAEPPPPGPPLWTLELGISQLRGHPEGPESFQPGVQRSRRRSSLRYSYNAGSAGPPPLGRHGATHTYLVHPSSPGPSSWSLGSKHDDGPVGSKNVICV